ncbi:MAG: GGDEF domain-containing protein [Acidobacteriota bacterium]|nr:MAG: GGDEF domain-containing protein [Acidobacteriota bacterium]
MSEIKFPSAAATTFIAAFGAFAIGIAEIDAGARIVIFILIVAAATGLTYLQLRETDRPTTRNEDDPVEILDEIESALGERETALASSLHIPDAFRIIVARLRSVTNFRGAALWLEGDSADKILVVETEGDHQKAFIDKRAAKGSGLAGRAWESGRVESGFESTEQLPSVAMPLKRGAETIAVLQLVFEPSYNLARIDRSVFDAIAIRSEPVIGASLAFEKNSTNALIDELTGIPNERAFYLVLEQHVAESQRRGADRPITVVALNIRDFDAIVLAYGGAAGDRVLTAVSGILKELLRSMDTITRSRGDEFLIVLPTATREIATEIVARIHSAFYTRKIEIVNGERLEIRLNIGSAHFGEDGDTPARLLQSARRTRESRRDLPSVRIIDFPNDTAV